MREMVRAHIQAYEILHTFSKNSECWVSLAHHMTAFSPCRKGFSLDPLSLFLREGFLNQLILQSLLSGFLFYPGIFCEKLSAKKTLDFIGVNYYTRDFIRFDHWIGFRQFGTVCAKDHHEKEVACLNDLGWEVYPEGIRDVVSSLKRYRLPVIVTENGICTNDDRIRQRFIQEHMDELEKARLDGVPVGGYFYWSLVDNFEWAEGFKPRFGIVEIDYATQKRNVRASAETLRKNCEKIFGPAREEQDARRTV